ncbi:preprotein translocase subunit SecG [Roseovarius spongiae]|uniref:Protein-export membrane protein SecG n=1 Tax=Roseovarius spongiae TaxID=2320272 RepID=A0A3A8ATE1_9RHOB|nr:preprotein translocase subunit SecG [Roseovarius spongiae]RKF14814.1 preprotein translocase subunit SecG [Roseovarius spongiae]
MENVVLIIHLLLALSLIGVVLLQRSEGGGLGMGGGGGGAMTGRSAGTAMGKLTWILAVAFICTSLALTIIAAQNASGSSVLDRIMDDPGPAAAEQEAPALPDGGGSLLPPAAGDDAPLAPTAD